MSAAVSSYGLPVELGIKPLSARSVVGSVLMGAEDRGVSASLLVRIAGLFDVSEGAARVAMSRMAAADEVRTKDGQYWLAGPLAIYERRLGVHKWPELAPWDGSWAMRVVTIDGRSHVDRQALRRAMRALRFAEFAGGCWIRPDNIVSGLSPAAEEIAAKQCAQFTAIPQEPARPLAHRLWDLKAWNSYTRALLRAMADVSDGLGAGDVSTLAPGLVLSAAVIAHSTLDPLLPTELLPPGWLGPQLREAVTVHDAAWQRLLGSWARSDIDA